MPSVRAVRFDAERGTLSAPDNVLRALLSSDAQGQRALQAVGAINSRGRVHQVLAPVLEALRHPDNGVFQLSYRGRALDGWRQFEVAALLTPPGLDGARTLTRVENADLPAAIVKAAALRRRPRPPAAVRSTRAVMQEAEIVRWWHFIHGPRGGSAGGLLEVLDTTTGLYIVRDREQAIPTDAEAVLVLVKWLLDGGEALPPLSPLPFRAPLPQPAPSGTACSS